MTGKYAFLTAGLLTLLFACSSQDSVKGAGEQTRQPPPVALKKPKPGLLTPEQRVELGFPEDIIVQVEAAADSSAEPFFEEVMIKSENLKGDVRIAHNHLRGFSVRTSRSEEVQRELAPTLRKRGFFIFRSEQNVGKVPDRLSVIKGGSSYDILLVQRTEATNYHLDTKAIIAWLKEQQKTASFVVTGAGGEWMEAKFITRPKNMKAFARKVSAFAPDVLTENTPTIEKLAERFTKNDGFSLWWD